MLFRSEASRVSRTPQAAAFLKANLKPGDRLLVGTQQPTVLYWYLHEIEGVEVAWTALMGIPPDNENSEMLRQLRAGEFSYFALANTFDPPRLSSEIGAIVKDWRIVYKSHERAGTTPRFVLYQNPRPIRRS